MSTLNCGRYAIGILRRHFHSSGLTQSPPPRIFAYGCFGPKRPEAIPETSTNVRVALLGIRAHLSQHRGDLETAARTCEQLRKEHSSLGNTHGEQLAATNLAEIEKDPACCRVLFAIGRLSQARAAAVVGSPIDFEGSIVMYSFLLACPR
jgi:hypothetical protein